MTALNPPVGTIPDARVGSQWEQQPDDQGLTRVRNRSATPVSRPGVGEGYLAALWLVSPILPWLAAIVTVLAYLVVEAQAKWAFGAVNDPLVAVGAGIGVGFVVWLVLAVFCRQMTTAATAQPAFYSEVEERYDQLQDRALAAVTAKPAPGPAAAAVAEACTQLRDANDLLNGVGKGPALRWARADGYVRVNRALHRAEEALLMAAAPDDLLGETLHDWLSLEGSTIGDLPHLQDILRATMRSLSPSANLALLPPEQGTTETAGKLAAKAAGKGAVTAPKAAAKAAGKAAAKAAAKAAGKAAAKAAAKAAVTAPNVTSNAAPNTTDAPLNESQAREALREVLYALNIFRDDARDGLIIARNRLVSTMLLSAVAPYLLLALVLSFHVATIYIGTASAFFLVGAILGLFDRLRVQETRMTAVEDFGLSQARLLATPLASGLAAVAGVCLVSLLPLVLPGASNASGQAIPLTTIFDLSKNQMGLVYAAIFGLVPGILTRGLRQQSDLLETDLFSSQPGKTAAGSGAAGG